MAGDQQRRTSPLCRGCREAGCRLQAGGAADGPEHLHEKGGLWLTLALAVPEIEVVRQATMVAAHAVSIAIERETSLATLVKWPNDLLCDDHGRCAGFSPNLFCSQTPTSCSSASGSTSTTQNFRSNCPG